MRPHLQVEAAETAAEARFREEARSYDSSVATFEISSSPATAYDETVCDDDDCGSPGPLCVGFVLLLLRCGILGALVAIHPSLFSFSDAGGAATWLVAAATVAAYFVAASTDP